MDEIKDRVLALGLSHKLISDALGHRRLAGPDVAVENHQRILLGDEIADCELAAMMLAVPVPQATNIQEQPKLVVDAGITRRKAKQRLFPLGERLIGKWSFAIEGARLAHAAQSFLCMP
ncbi:hypothetical protein [Nitrobacter sp.]|uniref:hypothetical protein n=1 Tax=Nitrobacter sp. TaxID=29420 RepID=UPI003F650BDF